MNTRAPRTFPAKRKRALSDVEQAIAFHRRSRFFVQIAAAWAFSLGGVALIGWSLKSEMLKSIVPGSSPLKPNIAAGMLLCAAVLALLAQEKVDKWLRRAIGVVALAVILVALATLGEHFFDWSLGIDRWFVRDFPVSTGVANPGRMMPTTAFCFVLMGTALLAEAQLTPRRFRFPLVAGLSAALVMIGVLALGGFSLEKLVGPQWNLMGMSLSGVTASVGFMILGSGILALLQSEGALTWSLNASTTAGFAVGIFLTVLTTASAFTFGKEMLETNTWVTHRQEVVKKIQEVITDMVELASREGVYIITGNEQLLLEREPTKTEARGDLSILRTLTADNPNQQRRLDQLEALITQRINWEEQSIALRRSGAVAEAAERVAKGPGLSLSDRILQILKGAQEEEYALLSSDRKQAERASTATFLLLPLGVFVSVGVLSLSLFFLNAGVSEQKKADNALRVSEEGMRAVLESALDSIITMDGKGRVVAFNPAAEKTFGYQRSEAVGQSLAELIIPAALRERHGRGLSHYLATGAGPVLGKRIELTAMRADRSEFPVELAITRIGSQGPPMFTGFIRDITERKEAEEAAAQLAAIVESSDDAIIGKDLQGIVTSWNAGAEKMFGYAAPEIIGLSITRLIPPARQEEEGKILDRIRRGERVRHFETVRVRKDGSTVDVSTAISAIKDRRGKIVGASKVVRDITERKSSQEALRQLNASLEQRVLERTEQLEAANKELEAFSYSVSHDLRAPLRAISGFSRIVLEDHSAALDTDGLRYLHQVEKSAGQMGQLIDDLLTFSRTGRQALTLQTVSTAGMVNACLADLKGMRKNRHVTINVGELPDCEADASLLKQVWLNLLANALKYTRKRDAAVITIGSERETGTDSYFVQDNGAGFDMKYADKLFGVFQRLHLADDYEGTGVGLALVQRIVQRHGGTVWAEAKLNLGATFHFTLTGGQHA